MRNLETRFVWIYLIVLLTWISAGNAFAQKYNLTEQDASKIIVQHFEEYYSEVEITTSRYESMMVDKEALKRQVDTLDKWKQTGLIDYKAFQKDMGLIIEITVTLTPKGRDTYHIVKEDNSDIIGFVLGKRKVIQIVKIDPTNETVYFSYTFEPSEIGKKVYDIEPAKYRGKAKIVYDPFLEKYAFKGMMWSVWEREDWQHTSWSYEIEGKKVFSTKTE